MIIAIFPCYNEAETLRLALESLISELEKQGEEFRIIVVDDGSTDDSQKIYSEFVQKNKDKFELIRFEQNRGVGEVFKAGFAKAIEIAKEDDDAIIIVEADGTNELELISCMRDQIRKGADIVIASRYLKSSVVTGMPIHRRILSSLLNFYLRIRFKELANIHDFSYFFKAISAGAVKRALERHGKRFIISKGFPASTELTIKILALSTKSVELPTRYFYQSRGKSKLKIWTTIREYISLVKRVKMDLM